MTPKDRGLYQSYGNDITCKIQVSQIRRHSPTILHPRRCSHLHFAGILPPIRNDKCTVQCHFICILLPCGVQELEGTVCTCRSDWAASFCCAESCFSLRCTCRARKFLKIRPYVFGFVTLVGVSMAFAGIPFYQAELAMCYISGPPLETVRAFSCEVGHSGTTSRHATISLFNAGCCLVLDSDYFVLYGSRGPLSSRHDDGVPGAGQICTPASEEECKMGCPKNVNGEGQQRCISNAGEKNEPVEKEILGEKKSQKGCIPASICTIGLVHVKVRIRAFPLLLYFQRRCWLLLKHTEARHVLANSLLFCQCQR